MMGERQTDHPALFYEFSLERQCLAITCCGRLRKLAKLIPIPQPAPA